MPKPAAGLPQRRHIDSEADGNGRQLRPVLGPSRLREAAGASANGGEEGVGRAGARVGAWDTGGEERGPGQVDTWRDAHDETL
jgi:hypothetical protein